MFLYLRFDQFCWLKAFLEWFKHMRLEAYKEDWFILTPSTSFWFRSIISVMFTSSLTIIIIIRLHFYNTHSVWGIKTKFKTDSFIAFHFSNIFLSYPNWIIAHLVFLIIPIFTATSISLIFFYNHFLLVRLLLEPQLLAY